MPINSDFDTFWTKPGQADIQANVVSVKPDTSLADLPPAPDRPFKIEYESSGLTALRRAPDGTALWSIETPHDLHAYSVRYNPDIFEKYYFSVDDLVFKDVGLLILVLSLHAKGGLLFHGSASVFEESGILCVGPSGIGKSTISRILHNCGATILSCERPVVRLKHRKETIVYGTPWPNIGGFALNASAPLKRIYFLEQASENRITPLSAKEASPRLIRFANILWDDSALLDPCLQTVEALLANVPAAVLAFRPDESVVDVIRQDLATSHEAG